MMTTVDLRCNDLREPLGVDKPHFSWRMAAGGKHQTGYRIEVQVEDAVSAQYSQVWDTGYVESSDCVQIPYAGEQLKPHTPYRWRVCQWDENGEQGPWSQWATFETSLMDRYQGQWIGLPEALDNRTKKDPLPAPLLRKSFVLPEGIRRGRIYLCGLGYYVLYVNGKRAGDAVLAPGVSQYDQTVYYDTVDVTDLLHAGENVFGVILGNGWYNSYTYDPWNFREAPWRGRPKLWLEAHITMENGEDICVASDTSWKGAFGPIRTDGLRHGELYDARLAKKGWAEPGYDDSEFLPVRPKRTPGGLRKSGQFTPIRRIETIQAVAITQPQPDVWVYDFGRNISGVIRVNAPGFEGKQVTFKYSERLDDAGMIERKRIAEYTWSGEFQTDHYVMRGDAMEIWSPEFTYHGFRYVEITGYPGMHTKEAFQADVIYTDFEKSGEFVCSDEMLNQIQKVAMDSTLTNYHGMPTDCPHREKNGWTGDAQISAEQVLMNFDPRTAYRKWMSDIEDAQRPDGHLPGLIPSAAWGYNRTGVTYGYALTVIPWLQYVYYKDIEILRSRYAAMKKYFENTRDLEVDGIIAVDGEMYYSFGDWLPPGQNEVRKCPTAITETTCYYQLAKKLSQIAELLSEKEDAEYFAQHAQRIREAFRKAFIKENPQEMPGCCQTALGTVMFYDLLEQDEKEAYLKALVEQIHQYEDHLDCGFSGFHDVLHALTDNGEIELVYEILKKDTYPSIGYMLRNNATTLWETWEGDMSQNHHAYSDVSLYFYRGLAGIQVDPAHPGFRKFTLKPGAPKKMQWVKAWHNCSYGRIESAWSRNPDGTIDYSCVVPPNTQAELILFDGSSRLLQPGEYKFTVKELA